MHACARLGALGTPHPSTHTRMYTHALITLSPFSPLVLLWDRTQAVAKVGAMGAMTEKKNIAALMGPEAGAPAALPPAAPGELVSKSMYVGIMQTVRVCVGECVCSCVCVCVYTCRWRD